MSAEVSYKGSNRFTIKITNETTGKSFSKTSVVVGARREGAEWIASGLCCTSGGGIRPRADFVKANFGDDLTGISGTNYATDESISGPISDFGTSIIEVTMVNSKGVTKAKPSALSTRRNEFLGDFGRRE